MKVLDKQDLEQAGGGVGHWIFAKPGFSYGHRLLSEIRTLY